MSATAARNNFFELLNQVAAGQSVIIEKDKKEVAVIQPKKEEFDWKSYQKILAKTKGSWAGDDWEETEKKRRKIEIAATKKAKAATW